MTSININFFKKNLNKKDKVHVVICAFLNFITVFVELFTIAALIPLIIVILKGDINEINLGFLNDFKYE